MVLLATYSDVLRAVDRVQDLTGCLEDTPEEVELIQLVAALEMWVSLRSEAEGRPLARDGSSD
ncbi:hypothetical protein BIWAKO_04646 [Bosea sp. BIWAKO-01]|nr:hypothetical protein BIWAKO_04646 [Bosea sp. BIWAKO-01]